MHREPDVGFDPALPLAQGAILESRDRVPCRAPSMEPASPSACVSASLSLFLSLSLSLYVYHHHQSINQSLKKNPASVFVNHKKKIEQFAETLNGWVTTHDATSIPNFSYMGARLCNYLSHHLTISPQSGNFHQLLLQRSAKGDEVTRKRFHVFVLFLGELYLNLEIKGTIGQVTRADILQVGLRELLNALFSNPMDDNLICAVKLLKLTGSVLEDAWKEKGKNDIEEIIQRIENMLLKLVELRSSNWGRVHATSTYREKYQELLEREDFFPDYEENGTDLSGAGGPYLDDIDDEMDPEI
ncbi:unnamed protein product [Nyctereutes procyonoides]|uniref:Polyadenylate-binding protein-interacting protein 1 n=1 Tax=Nyctereutes procyonoides TaxID=34880 RepID=A0A811Z8N0_NYCPR|nr:unnamed protein product [Nyctereutes procyonoides]